MEEELLNMNSRIVDAYDESRNSFVSGLSLSSNPYSYDLADVSNHSEWESGWISAQELDAHYLTDEYE